MLQSGRTEGVVFSGCDARISTPCLRCLPPRVSEVLVAGGQPTLSSTPQGRGLQARISPRQSIDYTFGRKTRIISPRTKGQGRIDTKIRLRLSLGVLRNANSTAVSDDYENREAFRSCRTAKLEMLRAHPPPTYTSVHPLLALAKERLGIFKCAKHCVLRFRRFSSFVFLFSNCSPSLSSSFLFFSLAHERFCIPFPSGGGRDVCCTPAYGSL